MTTLAQNMNIVIVGHVDHGKSTIIGRMMADTASLPEGKLAYVKAQCEANARPFEYAFLLDALADERAQGITIDVARCFFETRQRKYLILDAPGHSEFLKNMVTGAAHAEAALLVIDAKEGVQDNSKRHAYMLSLLGVKQMAVLINKMDLVDYAEETFQQLVTDCRVFLNEIGLSGDVPFIPVSGREGDGVAIQSTQMSWYQGPTVLEQLDVFEKAPNADHQPLRLMVQDVYKFTEKGDDRRIVVGKIESGVLRVGDEITFYPSGKKTRVKRIETVDGVGKQEDRSGMSTGFTIDTQVYVPRGEIAVRSDQSPPQVMNTLRASVFWLGKRPLVTGKAYVMKLGTAHKFVEVESIEKNINAVSLKLETIDSGIAQHHAGECLIKIQTPLACDISSDHPMTSRFVLVEDHQIVGGGIVLEPVSHELDAITTQVQMRNMNWVRGNVSADKRAALYGQKPHLYIVTGQLRTGRKTFAKQLEERLLERGLQSYYLGIGSVTYGVDADIKQSLVEMRSEHIRRYAEVLHILIDAGQVVVGSAAHLTQGELSLMFAILGEEVAITTIGFGDEGALPDVDYYYPSLGDVADQDWALITGCSTPQVEDASLQEESLV